MKITNFLQYKKARSYLYDLECQGIYVNTEPGTLLFGDFFYKHATLLITCTPFDFTLADGTHSTIFYSSPARDNVVAVYYHGVLYMINGDVVDNQKELSHKIEFVQNYGGGKPSILDKTLIVSYVFFLTMLFLDGLVLFDIGGISKPIAWIANLFL